MGTSQSTEQRNPPSEQSVGAPETAPAREEQPGGNQAVAARVAIGEASAGDSDTPTLDAAGIGWISDLFPFDGWKMGDTQEGEAILVMGDEDGAGDIAAETTPGSSWEFDWKKGARSWGPRETTESPHEYTDEALRKATFDIWDEEIEGMQTRRTVLAEELVEAVRFEDEQKSQDVIGEMVDLDGEVAARAEARRQIEAGELDPRVLQGTGVEMVDKAVRRPDQTTVDLTGVTSARERADGSSDKASVTFTGGGVGLGYEDTTPGEDGSEQTESMSAKVDERGAVITLGAGDKGADGDSYGTTQTGTLRTDEVGYGNETTLGGETGTADKGTSHEIKYGGGFGAKLDIVPIPKEDLPEDHPGTRPGAEPVYAVTLVFYGDVNFGVEGEAHDTAKGSGELGTKVTGGLGGGLSVDSGFDFTYQRELSESEVDAYRASVETGEEKGKPEFGLAASLATLDSEFQLSDLTKYGMATGLKPGESMSMATDISATLCVKGSLGAYGLEGKVTGGGSKVVKSTGTAEGMTIEIALGSTIKWEGSGKATFGAVTLSGGGSSGEENKIKVTTKPLDTKNPEHVRLQKNLSQCDSWDGLEHFSDQHLDMLTREIEESETLKSNSGIGLGPSALGAAEGSTLTQKEVISEEGLVGSGAKGTHTRDHTWSLWDMELWGDHETDTVEGTIEEEGIDLTIGQETSRTRLAPNPMDATPSGIWRDGLKAEVADALTAKYTEVRKYEVDQDDMDVIMSDRVTNETLWGRCAAEVANAAVDPWLKLRDELLAAKPAEKYVEAFGDDPEVLLQAERLAQVQAIARHGAESSHASECWNKCLRHWGGEGQVHHDVDKTDLADLHQWPTSMADQEKKYVELDERVEMLPADLAKLDVTLALDRVEGEVLCDELLAELADLKKAVLAGPFQNLRAQSDTAARIVDFMTEARADREWFLALANGEFMMVGGPTLPSAFGTDFADTPDKKAARVEAEEYIEVMVANKAAEAKQFEKFDDWGWTHNAEVFRRGEVVEELDEFYEGWIHVIEKTRAAYQRAGIPVRLWKVSPPEGVRVAAHEPDVSAIVERMKEKGFDYEDFETRHSHY